MVSSMLLKLFIRLTRGKSSQKVPKGSLRFSKVFQSSQSVHMSFRGILKGFSRDLSVVSLWENSWFDSMIFQSYNIPKSGPLMFAEVPQCFQGVIKKYSVIIIRFLRRSQEVHKKRLKRVLMKFSRVFLCSQGIFKVPKGLLEFP